MSKDLKEMEMLAMKIPVGKSILGKGTEATANSSSLESTQCVQGQQRDCSYGTGRGRELGAGGEARERRGPDVNLQGLWLLL